MGERTRRIVRLAYGAFLGAFTIVLGALFIWQAADLYFSGTAAGYTGTYIFTRERVGERLALLAAPFWVWVAAAAVGFVIWEVFPVAEKRSKPDPRYLLRRMKKRMPPRSADPSADEAFVRREETILLVLRAVAAAFCTAVAVYAIVYLATPSNFSASANAPAEVVRFVKYLMPWIAGGFLLFCGIAIYEGVSAKRQIDPVKRLTKGRPLNPAFGEQVAARLERKPRLAKIYAWFGKYGILVARVAVGVAAVVFILVGIFNGSARAMVIKAINICTECIGLG